MIQVRPALIAGCKNDCMVGRHLLDVLRRCACHRIYLRKCAGSAILKHWQELHKDLCGTPGIIDCTVMILQGHADRLCNRIQLETV